MDLFAQLIDDLSELIASPLYVDSKRRCQLLINHELHLFLQEQDNDQQLLISTFLGDLPPGKFREKILKAALKENGSFERILIFCYSDRNNQFAAFNYISFENLSADILADALELFLDRAFLWKKALQTGEIPSLQDLSVKKGLLKCKFKR
jgi:hypothetical protein